MENYVITKLSKRGLHIGQNKYTEEEANKRMEEMKALGHKNLKVMTVQEALGLVSK